MIILSRLTLKNFAVVSGIAIELEPGLTAITGETGAGKSLIAGAISLLLGERGKTEYLRAGATHALIEGEFRGDLKKLRELLVEEEVDGAGETLTVVREIHADGKNRCLINDQRVSLATLKRLGERICDLHGQHQHQWLLEPGRHLWFLDRFAGCGETYAAYRSSLETYRSAKLRVSSLEKQIAENREKQELHRFQFNEIEAANLAAGEEEALEAEQKQLQNILRIKEALANAAGSIEEERGAAAITGEVLKQLKSTADAFAEVNEYIKELESIKVGLVEIGRSLNGALSRLSEDPARLEQIGERLAEIYKLKRKYGGSVAAVLALRDELRASLDDSGSLELELKELTRKLEPLKGQLLADTERLQAEREAGAKKLAKAMKKELTALGLPKVEFEMRFAAAETGEAVEAGGGTICLADYGPQFAEFYFSANIGEEAKALAQAASGGEISRVMLALKSLIAGKDRVDLLVFDEIDAGIGGETALLVGRKLRELAARQQVIAITHLQQIAAVADQHLRAIKKEVKGRTETELIPLEREERIVELGRMISGGKFGEVERKQAEKLMKEARGE
ncbi:MAG: DNA repair protein RecN [candidate division Zixibacteria bacterium]|nr:DNA repair protein RecN [candidate division Zixibacteria bacterium]